MKVRYEDHFESHPDVQGGKPVIKGTRVLVRDVMQLLAQGATSDQVRQRFPELSERDIRAVLAFAVLAAD